MNGYTSRNNPILAALRRFTEAGMVTPHEAVTVVLERIEWERWDSLPAASYSQIEHAQKVLEKLETLHTQ